MKQKIIELLRSTQRPGIENLINHMEEIGFFTAPCSTQYHLCKEGGLAEHSLNVFHNMWDVAAATGFAFLGDREQTRNNIIIASLLHDLGKSGQFGKPNYIPNMIQDKKNKGEYVRSEAKPYETNKDLLAVPHEIRSIHIASQFIELTEQESFAILFHNGLYGDLKYAYTGKETPLSMLLHFSDMWCSRVVEVE
jgi:23S rRNA maturation-related 3'-5' exoribonuclease YhaM